MNFPDDVGSEFDQAAIEKIFYSNGITNMLDAIALNRKQRKIIERARRGGWDYHRLVRGYGMDLCSVVIQVVDVIDKTLERCENYYYSFDTDVAFVVNAIRNCKTSMPIAVVIWAGQCHPIYSTRTTVVMPGLTMFLCKHRCINLDEFIEGEAEDEVALRALVRKANTMVVKTGGEGFVGKIPQELIIHGRLIDPVKLSYSNSETRRKVLGAINM